MGTLLRAEYAPKGSARRAPPRATCASPKAPRPVAISYGIERNAPTSSLTYFTKHAGEGTCMSQSDRPDLDPWQRHHVLRCSREARFARDYRLLRGEAPRE